MLIRRRSKEGRPWGFTLVELLTVIAIIAILATLLSSGLASAKRKARQTASISNLRQIALAVNIYLDDHQRRPDAFFRLVDGNYLTPRVLLCPEDKTTNWAGFLVPSVTFGAPGRDNIAEPIQDVPHSYFGAFNGSDLMWQQIQRSPFGGIAACQLHGIGRPDSFFPSLVNFQGLVLRALKDGAVVQRQVFWDTGDFVTSGPNGSPPTESPVSTFPFFLDPVPSP